MTLRDFNQLPLGTLIVNQISKDSDDPLLIYGIIEERNYRRYVRWAPTMIGRRMPLGADTSTLLCYESWMRHEWTVKYVTVVERPKVKE